MSATLHRPLLLLNLYLDNDPASGGPQVKNFAGKTITFHEVTFQARVLSWGTIDRSISNPPGAIQIDDAEIELADTDGNVRAWFDSTTPYRRIGEIIFDFENNLDELNSGTDFPVMGRTSNFTNTNPNPPVTNSPIQDQFWKPLFTGEIVAPVRFQPGKVIIRLQEVTTKFLNWEIPKLITRDNFSNLPDDANEGGTDYTAPIIFGRVISYSDIGIEPQGAIRCWLIDTHLNRYCVARHTCFSVFTVYRKRKLDARFKVVSPTEYAIHNPTFTFGGISYTFTVIDFISQQEDGSIIHCDASGINFRYDPSTGIISTGSEQRNAVDAIFNLIFYAANDHPFIANQPQTYIRFDPQSFVDTGVAVSSYLCDGAITDSMNLGRAISDICRDFSIDFYEDNQARIAVHFYNPTSDSHIPIDNKLVLLKTLEPELPTHYFTRSRYNFFRQNAHLTEWTKSSVEGQWVEEKTLDNVTDQFELAQTGSNPILEIRDKLGFVRDEATALSLQKIKMGYYNLRAYPCEFEVPIPEVILYLQLTTCISLTHIQGIGPVGTGWLNLPMRVYHLAFDLKSYRLTVRAIVRVSVPDSSFQYSGTTSPHALQNRIPALPVLINGSLDDGIGPGIAPDAEPQLNIIDSDAILPDSTLEIPSTFSFSYRDGTTGTKSSDEAVVVPVKWVELQDVTPRVSGGYVLVPGGKFGVKYYIGTLSPDTRPTASMTDADIHKSIFYSTDFDHEYWWVGTGETGTASGWLAIEQSAGNIVMRSFAPTGAGWHKCDGTSVSCSDYEGTVASVTLPDLTGGTYPKLSTSPNLSVIAAHAPGASSASAGAHTHPGSFAANHHHTFDAGTHTHSFNAGNHTHTNTVTLTDPGHSHTFAFAFTGETTSSNGSHSHTGSTNSGTPDGLHTHTGATGPSSLYDLSHHHSVSTVTGTESNGHSHLPAVSGSDTAEAFIESPVDIAYYDTITSDESSSHTHGLDTNSGDADIAVDAGAIDVTVPNTSSSHTHTISSDGSHTHSLSGFGVSGDTTSEFTNVEVDVSIHNSGVSGTTAASGVTGTTDLTEPEATIISDGAHTHTITVDATAEPKHLVLMAYMRL